MQKTEHQIYSFGEFTLNVTRGCLLRRSVELKLRPKSFEVLKFLVENSGRLVGKDELIDFAWQGMAVTDDSLVQCLKDIRTALDDRSQTYIKTVPRRGYIFEKEVRENAAAVYFEETASVRLIIEETEERDSEIAFRRSKAAGLVGVINKKRQATYFTLALLTLVAAIVGAWRFNWNNNSDGVRSFQNIEVKSLTHVGNVINSAISPDGKWIAYTTGDAGRESVWLRQVATDSIQQRVPSADARYYGVSFSRDGDHIFYLRAENSNRNFGTLYKIATLGGVPEKVLEDLDWCPTFSPDGRQMTFVRSSESRNESVLMIVDIDGRNERSIAVRKLNEAFGHPAWSPDGLTIAVAAGSVELGDSFRDVVAVNVADRVETTVTRRKWYWIGTLAWMPDGSGLVISANPKKSHLPNQLWLLSYPSGEARQITNDSNNYLYVSMTADSRTLLAGHTELLANIWIAPEGDASRARRITSGLGDFKQVRWTPDGKLAVAAFGNNNIDVYMRDPGSTETTQLTVNAGTNWGQDASPDGRYITFDSDRTGEFHVWRMDADGGNPVQLTNGRGEKFAEISPDGKWVVYTSFSDWTLWKIPIEGGEPIQIAENYARQSSISPDGKWIVYMTFENKGYPYVLRPFSGEGPGKTISLPQEAAQMQTVQWSRDSMALRFVAYKDGVGNIWEQPIQGGAPSQVTYFASDRIFSYDWSEDSEQLAIIRGSWTSDMVLISTK
jgi:Tol biopolymer transport system component/DNA-binding winged helix-turn-helix (wHTH) protein